MMTNEPMTPEEQKLMLAVSENFVGLSREIHGSRPLVMKKFDLDEATANLAIGAALATCTAMATATGDELQVPLDRHKRFVDWSNALYRYFMSEGFQAMVPGTNKVSLKRSMLTAAAGLPSRPKRKHSIGRPASTRT